MKYLVLAIAVVGLLGLGVFTPQREHTSVSGQERPFVVRVPQEYPTIQQAVDAVAEGGTVLISPGTYHESIRIAKSLRLVGAGQELVHIQADEAIHIEAERPSQVYLANLSIKAQQLGLRIARKVQATIERLTVISRNIGIELTGVSASLSKIMVSQAQLGILAFGGQLSLQGATLRGNHIGIGLAVYADLSVQDSIIKENDIGIAAVIGPLGGRGILYIGDSLLSSNMLAAVAVIGSWDGLLEAFLSGNEISTNGVGIYLGYDFHQENQQKFGRPIPRLVRMFQNKILRNSSYGLVLERKDCQDEIFNKIVEEGILPFLPLPSVVRGEASLEGTVFTGYSNTIQDNGKADLCPPDYPWPPGFRR